MFVSDTLIFIELHKTGCTHIRNTLKDVLGGEFIGKHNQLDSTLVDSGRPIIGSVRDPWEWYTSLWAYGCDNKGAVFNQVTKPKRLQVRGIGWKKHPWSSLRTVLANLPGRHVEWRRTYRDVNDAGAFREWLHMLHDDRYWHDVGEGYGKSPLSAVAGLLTYRYVNLFCCTSDTQAVACDVTTPAELAYFERSNCFVDHFIRNERLAADLVEVLESSGANVPKDTKKEILTAAKTNSSSRRKGPSYYYDEKSEQLVLERERLLIEKFGYVPPSTRSQV